MHCPDGEGKMIIDFHTHTFPDHIASAAIAKMEHMLVKSGELARSKTKGTRASLQASTKESGVDLSVVIPVATSPRQTESINRFAIENNADTQRTGILSFGAIHPDNENYKQILAELKAAGMKGVKFHPDYQGVYFDDIRYLRIMEEAFSQDLIVVTHAGPDPAFPDDVHCDVDRIVSVLEQLQPEKLVLAHMGAYWRWEEVEAKLVGRNVYFDTANCFASSILRLSDEAFVRMVYAHGVDKILFGTDSPWTDQKEEIEHIRSVITEEAAQQKILGENAKKLLGI